MARIRILSDRVANQIAAGEVVERPAAAVKELVENSLDAGATRIEVEFRHGGRALIRVEDNGRGMDREDALLAFTRHATSKIAETADLDQLATFGFRGEGLPSIASVSRCTLQTRAEGREAGTEILVNAGQVVHVRDCGRPVGTRIEVEHLFAAVPARRKFLKTDRTEAGHIAQCVRLYALACPGVAFTLVEDGQVTFRSPECPTLADRVAEIFGRQLAETLVPVAAEEGRWRLHGLVGRPGAGRATRHETITFVNTRPVDSRTLNYALLESFRESLPAGRHPPAFLFFECDPAAVDVNVHPAKREVRFRDEGGVRSFVVRSLLQRLRELAPAADFAIPPPAGEGRLEEAPAPAAVFPAGPAPAAPAPASRLVPAARPSPPATAPAWRFLGLAHEAYALFETPSGLVLLDRRAAHERVWFERLQAQFQQGTVPSQRLLLPVPLELDPVAAALLLERREFLRAHGFDLAEFGRHFFRIEAVPDWVEPAEAEAFVRDILGAFREGRLAGEDPAAARDDLARLAATRAARLPAHAGEAELRSLAADLFATRAPLTSPAGRPTFIELGHGELARRFGK
jgi:DNA mismatch repair protein MutL